MNMGALVFLTFAWGTIFIMMYWSIVKLLHHEKQQKA